MASAFVPTTGLMSDHLEGCAIRGRVEAARTVFSRLN
jgi:hypothetical protein